MILVDIYVPSVDKTYDFDLDEDASVSVILDEIIEMIGQKERTSIIGDVNALMLCSFADKRMLPKNLSLKQCGIENGERLLLV